MPINDSFFVLKDERALRSLAKWLYRRSYNEVKENIIDKNEKQLIGLHFNYDPENPFSNRISKQGLILCDTPELHKRAVRLVRCHQTGNRQNQHRRAA